MFDNPSHDTPSPSTSGNYFRYPSLSRSVTFYRQRGGDKLSNSFFKSEFLNDLRGQNSY